MKCEECQTLIEEYLDGELAQTVSDAVAIHVENCLPCATTVQELTLETKVYQSYERRLNVSPDLWSRVRSQVAEESRPGRASLFARLQFELSNVLSRRFSAPAAVALVLLAIMSTVAVMKYLDRKDSLKPVASSVVTPADGRQLPENQFADARDKGKEAVQPVPGTSVARELTAPGSRKSIESGVRTENARSKAFSIKRDSLESRTPEQLVRDAEKRYLTAIVMLTKDVEERPAQLDPETRAKLDGALAAIDRTISATRKAVKQNPNDPLAVQYMLSAYGKKVDVLKEMTGY